MFYFIIGAFVFLVSVAGVIFYAQYAYIGIPGLIIGIWLMLKGKDDLILKLIIDRVFFR